MPDVDQWRATCYHEAAHAVFASEVCRGKVHYVSASESLCEARVEAPNTPASLWRSALYALAGSYAEMLEIWGEIRPDSWEEFSEEADCEEDSFSDVFDEWRSDAHQLREYLFQMGDPAEEYQFVVQDTAKLIRELWPEISSVAFRLLKAGHLEGDEVATIIESVKKEYKHA